MAGIGLKPAFAEFHFVARPRFSTSALLSFGYGVAEVLGGRSSRIVFLRCRKWIEIASRAVFPRLLEALPLGAGIDISNRC